MGLETEKILLFGLKEKAKVWAWIRAFRLHTGPRSDCRGTLWPAEGGVHTVGPLAGRSVRRLRALQA